MKTHVGITSVLRRYCVGIFAVALLAGCTPPLPSGGQSYRDETVTLAATTRFDTELFSGEWQTVARAPIGGGRHPVRFLPGQTECELNFVVHDPQEWPEFRNGRACFAVKVVRPGVLSLVGDGQAFPDLIVMWVDEGFNTAAVGWADGVAAYVLTRPGRDRRDQIAAAREVLVFNGWDVSELRTDE